MNLFDLAGSERADKTRATGDTLKEGISINKSLMALRQVINALVESCKGGKTKDTHFPDRESKLTNMFRIRSAGTRRRS